MNTEKETWCPMQGGEFIAYKPKFKKGESWLDVPPKTGPVGVPSPKRIGPIGEVLGLLGKDQALSLAHAWAADAAFYGDTIEVKVVPYKVVYEIKAKEIE